MRRLTKMLGLALAVSFAACGAPSDEPAEPEAITKDEARELGGKSDGIDWCDYLGWYGDGICDDFCAEPDPDCEPESCDDGSAHNPLCDIVPNCAAGTEPAIINGCFECVDPVTCEAPEPPSCDDGSTLNPLCDIVPNCDAGTEPAIINSCFECVDPDTCQAPEPSCDDGSELHPLCDIVPSCNDGGTPAIVNGCFECVDPDTCDPVDDGRTCGGIAGLQCPDGQVCKMPDGMCNVADGAGTCVMTGDACAEIYFPVCGCDGNTYSNECKATMAGVSLDHEGECLPPDNGGDCGGIAGLTCADGQYCEYEPDAMCGAADQLGSCTTMPEACITLYDPVCGCDGNTYSNSCFAAASGVSVASEGPCE